MRNAARPRIGCSHPWWSDVDTFEALVRLELAGWTVLPPEPMVTPVPPELGRLLKRASGLSKQDRVLRFLPDAPVPRRIAPTAPFRWTLASGLHGLQVGEELWVVEAADDGVVRLLARSLGDWLAQLLEPGTRSLPEAQPFDELGWEGEGRGWPVEQLTLPAVLDLEPDEVLQVGPDGLWVGQRTDVEGPRRSATVVEEPSDGADVDELFGEGAGRPRPRSALISVLLVVGLSLTVLGMACINAPGGLLVLLAWMFVEKDVERLEAGYLPEADRAEVERLRAVTHGGLLLVVALFFLQALLLCFGFYDVLLDRYYIPWWRDLVVSVLGESATP